MVQITEAMSGTQALEIMEKEAFDLILLDHMMPDIDGIETLKRLRASEKGKCKNKPVIALTANVFSGVRDMYLSEGFDDYLGKPISGKQLEEMLYAYLPKEKILETEQKATPVLAEEERPASEDTLIDRGKGLGYCANSQEIYHEMLMMFCELKESATEELVRYLEARDWKNYTVKVHALKTNARSIGASVLGELCYMLEQAGKKLQAGEEAAEQEAVIKEKHPEMLVLFEQTVEEAKSFLK